MSASTQTMKTDGPVLAGAHSHGGPVPTGSPAERFTSTDPEAFGKPTGREETWRFTPMRRVRPLLNGQPSDAHLAWHTDLPEGVELTSVEADDPLLKGLPEPADYLAALTRQRSGGESSDPKFSQFSACWTKSGAKSARSALARFSTIAACSVV